MYLNRLTFGTELKKGMNVVHNGNLKFFTNKIYCNQKSTLTVRHINNIVTLKIKPNYK